jgi:hypothetical protein
MKGGIKRAVLDLEYCVRAVFDHMGDGVAVGRTQQEGLENEQIERPLEEIGVEGRRSAFWHWSMAPVDNRLNFQKIIYGREIRPGGWSWQ